MTSWDFHGIRISAETRLVSTGYQRSPAGVENAHWRVFNGNAPLPGRRILLADIRGGRTYFELRLKPLLRCFQIAEIDVWTDIHFRHFLPDNAEFLHQINVALLGSDIGGWLSGRDRNPFFVNAKSSQEEAGRFVEAAVILTASSRWSERLFPDNSNQSPSGMIGSSTYGWFPGSKCNRAEWW
jgi:hypothetical protein